MKDPADPQSNSPPAPPTSDLPVDPQELSHQETPPRVSISHLTSKGLLMEAGLAVLALALAWIGFYDHQQDLTQWASWPWGKLVLIGVLGAIPTLAILLVIVSARLQAFIQLNDIVDDLLVPLFKGLPVWKLFLIAAAAGICEELLFRWCIQGGIAEWFANPKTGIAVSLLVASMLFGVCHWVNETYAVFAFLMGIYLGLMMVFANSFVAPAICHGIYDFVALVYLAYFRKSPDSVKHIA